MKDIFVARQPVFDQQKKIKGFELLYRPTATGETAEGESAPQMSSSVMVDAILGFGLQKLTDGHPAFLNLPESMLIDGTAELLDPGSVVVEILEDVRPTPEVLDACRRLKKAGHRIALDDFVALENQMSLLKVADIVKVDVSQVGDRLTKITSALTSHGVTLLAEKVEDTETHRRCLDLGFVLFQGFHYFRPEVVTGKDMAAGSVAVIRLINLLRDPSVTDRIVEEAFRSDPSLTYKLLRMVNSAALGGRAVEDIGHALRLMGREPLYRWMLLLLMSINSKGSGEVGAEIIKSSLLRGRMCEVAGDTARNAFNRDIPPGGTLFLIGLFSQMDQLVGMPLPEILESINVGNDVRSALLERTGKAGTLLNAVEAYVDAEWERAQDQLANVGVEPDAVSDIYLDALSWAGARMAFHQAA
ncbi:MAG: EAL and HDOD domain-containing protein [Gemmatimonadota bacterium]